MFVRVVVVLIAIVCGVSTGARAQDELKTSTELGITIAPDDIYGFIQETSDFWPLVQKYLSGTDCALATIESRQQAAQHFAQVNGQLQQWLYGDDEAAAADVIEYMRARLRRYILYRHLRATLNDDALLAELKSHWEQLRRDNAALATADVSLDTLAQFDQKRLEVLQQRLQQTRLMPEQRELVLDLWQRQAECSRRILATRVGRELYRLEVASVAKNPQTAQLIYEVQSASDWAQIVKSEGAMIKLPDFLSAWDSLQRYGIQAARQPTQEVLAR